MPTNPAHIYFAAVNINNRRVLLAGFCIEEFSINLTKNDTTVSFGSLDSSLSGGRTESIQRSIFGKNLFVFFKMFLAISIICFKKREEWVPDLGEAEVRL